VVIEKKVIEILAEQALLQPTDISRSSTLDELGLDSLALVEIVFAIEEQFEVSVPFNANDPSASDFDISSVQSIVTGVIALISEQKR
jgi:acyl carrier protein